MTQKEFAKLLMVGLDGKSLNRHNQKKLREIFPGGIILFGANIKDLKQTRTLIHEIYQLYDSAGVQRPFIAIDQEGGNVTRIKTKPRLPAPALFSQGVGADEIRNIAYFNAKLLRSLGITMNFSPVLDISSVEGKDFLGSRTFSTDAGKVGDIGERFIEGANEALVLSTAKHFPGHGDIVGDSHKLLPQSDKDLGQLMQKELLPYKQLLQQNKVPAIMVGHIALPKLIASGLPASFAPEINQDLLRKQLGFRGIVLTDDIQMEGAKITPHPGIRAKMAIESGVDMVMLAWNPKAQLEAFRYLEKEYESSPHFRKRVKESVLRLDTAKAAYQVGAPLSDPKSLAQIESDKRILEIEITRLFHQNGFTKKHAQYIRQQVSQPAEFILLSSYPSFFREFQNELPSTRVLFFHLNKKFTSQKLEQILKKYPRAPVYFQASQPAHLRQVSSLQPDLSQRIFVINGVGREKRADLQGIDTASSLPELGAYLARQWQEKRDHGPARSLSSQNEKVESN